MMSQILFKIGQVYIYKRINRFHRRTDACDDNQDPKELNSGEESSGSMIE